MFESNALIRYQATFKFLPAGTEDEFWDCGIDHAVVIVPSGREA